MAQPNSNYSELAAMTRELVLPGVVDQFFKSTPLLARWANKDFKDGGDYITAVVEFDDTDDCGAYEANDILPHVVKPKVSRARWNWKWYYSNITLLNTDLKLNRNNPHSIADMLQTHTKNAMKSMKTNITGDIFGDGTTSNVEDKTITGLAAAVDTSDPGTSHDYGGIDRSTYSWWQAGKEDSSTTAISRSMLTAAIGSLTDGSTRPSLILTTQTIWNYIHDLMEPQKRYQDTEMAAFGFRSVLVEGIPMVIDSQCTANYIYLLNEEYIKFITLQGENFDQKDVGEPHDQEVTLARILWAGNLICTAPRWQGKYTAITGTSS